MRKFAHLLVSGLQQTRNLLRIAVFNISYIRGLFPESYFNDKSVPALEMKIKKLMPMDAESRRLIDWMEKGVYDALQKKYLKTLLFCICEEIDGRSIEEYAFSFSYPCAKNEEVRMNISRNGSKKNGMTIKSNTSDITPDQMRSSACKMVRTLVSLMRTLDKMPEERIILMKLFYYEDVTPDDYEPPFFRSCSENEAINTWAKNPLKMEVGNVNSKHVFLALKVKSILDPCEDENDDFPEDEEVSLGDDSVQGDDYSSDSEVRPSLADKFIVAPIGKKNLVQDNGTISEDETQDAACEGETASQIRQWLNSRRITTIDLGDILANFPDISMELAEDIVESLLREGVISRAGKDKYIVNKEISSEACFVKQEVEMQEVVNAQKTSKNTDDDYMYMKALYHALPMDYVTIGKLQNKLEGEVSQNTVRKLLEKMAKDGYVESTANRRLGKRVIHSESSNRKLIEVKEILEQKIIVTSNDQHFNFNGADLPPNDQNMRDVSTYGGLHSIGSDLTRTEGRCEPYQNEEEEVRPHGQERGNTPVCKPAPIASIESGVLGERTNRRASCGGEECHSTQEKRSRKASTVKEPIIQYVKRQKSVK